ncbi:MAG: hypothetical protein AAFU71_09325 [Cyanobacteria bacterium J06632_22]
MTSWRIRPIRWGGIASILIAREAREQYLVSSFMIDYWCLGIKRAIPPSSMGKSKYKKMLNIAEASFKQPFIDITLKQAQSVVFGAAAYAEQLGLQPHYDFSKAQPQLGPRSNTLESITFGYHSRPFFVNGPHDNSHKILKTLTEVLGEGRFGYSLIQA